MNLNLKDAVKTVLPKTFWDSGKKIYFGFKKVAIPEPAVTVYLNRDDVQTFIGINNYFSWIAADLHSGAIVKADFYSKDGKLILKHKEKLSYFGTANLDVKAMLKHAGVISPYGIFSLQIEPSLIRSSVYKKLGTLLGGGFFSLYNFKNGSVSVVHPNSRTGKEPPVPNEEWPSLQLISTAGLAKIRFYQMMPVDHEYPMTYLLLCNQTGEEVAKKSVVCGPFSASEIEFDLKAIPNLPAQIRLQTSAWPINNSKPIIERVFESGLSSLSHS